MPRWQLLQLQVHGRIGNALQDIHFYWSNSRKNDLVGQAKIKNHICGTVL
jgi:hypothetical protein